MFRVMIRSFEGWIFSGSSAGSYWERREVWSTWTICDTYESAVSEADTLRFGGNVVAVRSEEEYPFFCASHTLC